ncbi:uncharacterized protein fam81b [Odontesthes bonariensis]
MKTSAHNIIPSSRSLWLDECFVELNFTKITNTSILTTKLFLLFISSLIFLDVLRGSRSSQDRTLAVLLEQAFRIKEEMAAGLQSNHGSVQLEALSRKLLENYILTALYASTYYFWCDASITKLSADVSSRLLDGKRRLKKWTEQQLNSFVQMYAQSSLQLRSLLRDKMVLYTYFRDRLLALEVHLGQFEMDLNQADSSQSDQLKLSEAKVSRIMTSAENSLHQELQLLKQEYHIGFLSVHDAIERRQILSLETLRKNVRHVCSK